MASAAALGAVGRGFKSLCSDCGGRDHLPPFFSLQGKSIMSLLATFYWNPDPVAFYIPIVNHPVVWYSLFFALGYLLVYLIVSKLIGPHKKFLESLAWYSFVGMLLGARLGHVFFYEWDYFKAHPLKILFTWEGGLASHGGAIGILIALWFFWSKHKRDIPGLTWQKLLDILTIAIPVAACCIRIGNFFNQEILGTATDLWWGVYFGHPAEANSIQPCHPVQLYEALFYLLTGGLLYWIYSRYKPTPGKTAGLFFILIFTFRFFIEFLKLPQTHSDLSGLYMGQLLSIPFIIFGIFLLIRPRFTRH